MLKKKNIYFIFIIIAIVLFIWYTYNEMRLLGFEESSGLSHAAITKLGIFVMAVMTIIISNNSFFTNFSILWILWIIWLFIDFYILGLRGVGVSNIFHVTFGPMTFILFYLISLNYNRVENMLRIGFLIIYLISIYLIYTNLVYFIGVQIGEYTEVTNLIYWSLCPLPLLLLYDKKWIQISIVFITTILVILTGKRSAFIIIGLSLLVYMFNFIKGRYKVFNIFILLLIVIGASYFVEEHIYDTFLGVLERMNNIKDDQGSGRIPLYMDVFDVMKNNDFIDWLVGRGFGSIEITKHSNAHNDALQMLFEYGIIGLVVYIFFIIYLITRTNLLRKKQSPYYIGYVISLIITIILGLVSNLIVFYSYFAFLCAYWGFVEAEMVKSGFIKKIYIIQS